MTTLPTFRGLHWRALTAADIDVWFTLVAESEQFDDASERHSRTELAEQFDGAWRDPLRDSVVGVDDVGVARAFGWVDTDLDGRTKLKSTLWGEVHPQWRGRGVGRSLLDWQLARARAALRASELNLPRQVVAFAQEGRDDRFAILGSAGFTVGRWFVDMRRPLVDAVPERRPQPGIEVRPWAPELSEATRRAHNEAFVDHWGSEAVGADRWEHFTRRAQSFRPDWSIVAVDVVASTPSWPVVAGYALNSAYPQGWQARGHTEGWTDLLGTVRAYRGRGVASAVLTASLRAFWSSQLDYAGLDVDTESPTGALGLYRRLGYESQQRTAALTLDV